MEFKQIRTFVALAECLHFGHAAEQLGIAQPHVSRRIKQLEDDLGVALFLRNRRNVKLTEAGRVFLTRRAACWPTPSSPASIPAKSALGRRGRLNLSLIASAMLGACRRFCNAFRSRYPDVHLAVRELDSAGLSRHWPPRPPMLPSSIRRRARRRLRSDPARPRPAGRRAAGRPSPC